MILCGRDFLRIQISHFSQNQRDLILVATRPVLVFRFDLKGTVGVISNPPPMKNCTPGSSYSNLDKKQPALSFVNFFRETVIGYNQFKDRETRISSSYFLMTTDLRKPSWISHAPLFKMECLLKVRQESLNT